MSAASPYNIGTMNFSCRWGIMIPFLWMETRWNWYMYIKDRYKNGELYPMKLDIFHFYGWKPNMYNYVYIKIYHTDYGEKFNHSRCIQQLLPVKSSCKSCRSTGSSKSKPKLPTAEMPGRRKRRRFSQGGFRWVFWLAIETYLFDILKGGMVNLDFSGNGEHFFELIEWH